MKGTGPFLNRRFYGEDRPRALFSGMPVGPDALGDFIVFHDDFTHFTDNEVFEDVSDASTTFALVADAENGVIRLTSQATTNDSGVLLQAVNTNFLCVAGRELMFEARVKISDVDDMDVFIGLADTAATDPEAVVAEGHARIGFELVDGAADILCVVDNDTAATKEDSGVDAADDTYIRLGFRIDEASIRYYINRSLVKTIALPTAIAAVTMGPAAFELSGSVSGTKSMDVDYITVISERS